MGITFRVDAHERYLLAAKSLTSDEAFDEFESLRDKLDELGVETAWMQTIRTNRPEGQAPLPTRSAPAGPLTRGRVQQINRQGTKGTKKHEGM